MVCLLLLAAPLGAAEGAVDFGRDVRPILAENCYQCHGQDAETREGKLRLDTREGQRKPGVIIPGHPDESELVLRINSPHADERMPPEESHRTLTESQKQTLRRWIAEGANFTEHWAFSPPRMPVLPRVRRPEWVRSPLDRFILARLDAAGVEPSPEADRERYLRRVTFDLTGVPPTLAELDAFIADRSSNAHETVVDRLLASPRYGERMAVEWLDIARYADTHGYQMDRPRPMWPYRDWVIGAFNRNVPYNEFITEQIAGDLLPNATREQRLATAFNRLHAQNEEGGIVDEEYRVSYVNDRVATFGTAVLGLTFDCARCHDHKFDPITQREFYSLAAFFQNIDEPGAISFKGFSDIMPPPVLKLPDATAERALASLAGKIEAQERALTVARQEAGGRFDAWLEARGSSVLVVDGAVTSMRFDELSAAGTPDDAGAGAMASVIDGAAIGGGIRGGGLVLSGDNGVALPDVPVFTRGDAFSFSLWVRAGAPAERAVVFHRSLAYTDAGSRGYELVLEQGRPAFALHRHWPGSSLKLVAMETLVPGEWTHLTLTYDGTSHAAGARIYVDGRPATIEVVRDKLGGDITYDRPTQPPLLIGHRFRDNGFKGGAVDEFQVYARELSPLEAAQVAGRPDPAAVPPAPTAAGSASERTALKNHYVRSADPAVRAATAALVALRREYVRAFDAVPEVMVMEELPRPREAFVLERGEYDRRGPTVKAGTPAALPAFPVDAPRNRLGLARWATDPANPLTARVAVNRLWQLLFERGLVESSDNFGITGNTPTHPELLDWLAVDFVAGGWDLKRMVRQIVLSATYRQSSRVTPEVRSRDPHNQWLGRAPARRLTAEMLRDQALAAGGLLVERLGGASVRPYQPEGLWEEIAMGRPKYEQSTGEGLYRRSLYTFIKRTVPPPAMIAFDATDRANCSVRRQATSTPLQALALLNDTQLVEAARFVAERMLREGGATAGEQVRFGFRLVTSRTPTAAEISSLVAALGEQEAFFTREYVAAAQLLCVGETAADFRLPVPRLAAATMVASALLNHDEAVMRR